MTMIDFSPLIPWWLIALLGTIGGILALYSLRASVGGAMLRLLGIALLCLGLLGTRFSSETRTPLSDIGLIIVDHSPSQRLGDRGTLTQKALEKILTSAKDIPRLELRQLEIGKDASGATQLLSTLTQARQEIPPERYAGAILISDGQIHDLDQASDLAGPLNVLLSGKQGEIDRRIQIKEAPRYGVIGQNLTVRFKVIDEGVEEKTPKGLPVKVQIGNEHAFTTPVDDNGIGEFSFSVDRAGILPIVLEAPALAGEITSLNNLSALNINGVRDRLKVLLVSGQPHPGERTWRNLLNSDAAVDLVHFTILRPPGKDDYTPLNELSLISFPVEELFERKLFDFDLVIFDRFFVRGVLPPSYYDNMVSYVKKGGAILVATGPDFTQTQSIARTSLGSILPANPKRKIYEEPFRASLSDSGKRHPVTASLQASSATWGHWFRAIGAEAKSGEILMEGPDHTPLLMLDRINEGRVALMLSDHVWLWARGYDGGGPYLDLLRRLAHWLMKEPELEENRLSVSAHSEDYLIERRTLEATDDMNLLVTAPDGTLTTFTMTATPDGQAELSIPLETAGLYRFESANLITTAAIGPTNTPEWGDMRVSDSPLEAMVDKIGGSFTWLGSSTLPSLRMGADQSRTSGRGWVGLRQNNSYQVDGVRIVTWPTPWVLLLLGAASFIFAWVIEGKSWRIRNI